MIIDCEMQCTIWNWNAIGKCPHSYANDDGGLWCFEDCSNDKYGVIERYKHQVETQIEQERKYGR